MEQEQLSKAIERAAREMCWEAKTPESRVFTLADLRRIGKEVDRDWRDHLDLAEIVVRAVFEGVADQMAKLDAADRTICERDMTIADLRQQLRVHE